MAIRDGRGILSSADWGFSPTLAIFGLFVWIGALWLFYATHRQLKRNWSQTLELREGHTLVTDGVYTLVRHPMYTAFFLWGVAQAFMLQNWIAGLAGIVGFGTLYLTRVNREEAMMREAFGTQYDSYVERTKRIVPYLH
jgi:protein-S-isoprenylcysteine O-methyltransferase Ste14